MTIELLNLLKKLFEILHGNNTKAVRDKTRAILKASSKIYDVNKKRKLFVLVQNDEKKGIQDAIIKVDSFEETVKTDAEGKVTLEVLFCTKFTVKVTASNKEQTVPVEVDDMKTSLQITFKSFTKLDQCITKNVDKLLFKLIEAETKDTCEVICYNADQCDYYFYVSGKCYCGDLDGTNPLPALVSLPANVDVYLKDDSKSINEAFNSCGIFTVPMMSYEKLQSCSTEGDKNFAKFLFKPGFPMPEANCKIACTNNPSCDYYFYQSGFPFGTCYCGDLDGPHPQTVSLVGTVDVYLKDSSESSNESFT